MFLQVKIPSCVLYHYDVAIVPDKCPRRVNREIVEALINAHADYFGHQKPVFDGRKNLYSRRPLPIGRDRVSSSAVMGKHIHTHIASSPAPSQLVSTAETKVEPGDEADTRTHFHHCSLETCGFRQCFE